MFPVSIDGEFALSTEVSQVDRVLDGIASALRGKGATQVARQGDSIVFRAGLLHTRGFGNWNILIPVGSGAIDALGGGDGLRVRYRLSTRELLGVVSALLVFATITPLVNGAPLESTLGLLAVGWLGLFGVNYLIAWFRLSNFIRKAATVNEDGPGVCPHCGHLYDPADYVPGRVKYCEACHEQM